MPELVKGGGLKSLCESFAGSSPAASTFDGRLLFRFCSSYTAIVPLHHVDHCILRESKEVVRAQHPFITIFTSTQQIKNERYVCSIVGQAAICANICSALVAIDLRNLWYAIHHCERQAYVAAHIPWRHLHLLRRVPIKPTLCRIAPA